VKHELKYLIRNPIIKATFDAEDRYWFDIEYVENYNVPIYDDYGCVSRKVSNTGFRLILHMAQNLGAAQELGADDAEYTHPTLFATYEDACNFRDYLVEMNEDTEHFQGIISVTNWWWDKEEFPGWFKDFEQPCPLEYVPTSLTN
jgi:hypothetical protein